jgi:hypothetical protein
LQEKNKQIEKGIKINKEEETKIEVKQAVRFEIFVIKFQFNFKDMKK